MSKHVSDVWIIDETASISPTSIVSSPFRPLLEGKIGRFTKTVIEQRVHVGHFSVIGIGCTISHDVIIDDYSKIEAGVIIGNNSLIIYRATICSESKIGSECVIGGFVTERVVIGSHSRVFGEILHRHTNMESGWDADEAREESPVIGANVFVGFGAKIIGNIMIGDNSYICAGSTVTKSVPKDSYVSGHNKIQTKKASMQCLP